MNRREMLGTVAGLVGTAALPNIPIPDQDVPRYLEVKGLFVRHLLKCESAVMHIHEMFDVVNGDGVIQAQVASGWIRGYKSEVYYMDGEWRLSSICMVQDKDYTLYEMRGFSSSKAQPEVA